MCGWKKPRGEDLHEGAGRRGTKREGEGGGRIIGIQFQDQGVMTPLLGRASG